MSRLTALAAMVLAACTASEPEQVAAFRQGGAPIWSAAAFDASRLDGRWVQAAGFDADGVAGCRAGEVAFTGQGAMRRISGRLCLNGADVALDGPAQAVGPGRIAVPGMADWWVIWVDSGYRTLAIATPSGRFGFVLDRGQISPDRRVAAAEIFAFNGYPKVRLLPF